jgi:hypothetical protein
VVSVYYFCCVCDAQVDVGSEHDLEKYAERLSDDGWQVHPSGDVMCPKCAKGT